MKDDWLKNKLAGLTVPSVPEVDRYRAREHALVAFRNRPRSDEPSRPALFWRWIVAASAVAVVALGVAMIDQDHAARRLLQADLQVLNQVSTLFPGHLEAVVERQGKVDVQLASGDAGSSEQPLILVFTKGGEVVRALSYSGREIRVRLGAGSSSLQVLSDGNGGVIVTGRDFLWSRQNPARLDGYRIQAATLQPAS